MAESLAAAVPADEAVDAPAAEAPAPAAEAPAPAAEAPAPAAEAVAEVAEQLYADVLDQTAETQRLEEAAEAARQQALLEAEHAAAAEEWRQWRESELSVAQMAPKDRPSTPEVTKLLEKWGDVELDTSQLGPLYR